MRLLLAVGTLVVLLAGCAAKVPPPTLTCPPLVCVPALANGQPAIFCQPVEAATR